MEKGMYVVMIVAVVAVVSLVILTTNTGKVSVQSLNDDFAGMANAGGGGSRTTTSSGSDDVTECMSRCRAVKDSCRGPCVINFRSCMHPISGKDNRAGDYLNMVFFIMHNDHVSQCTDTLRTCEEPCDRDWDVCTSGCWIED
mgnify:CR=1 FL=1